ncbi:MAG: DedA family protein [Acidimicrobiales bacterium]|jgi:membrane protein DedA with SNARE-associated domain
MLDASIATFIVDKIQSLPSGLVYTVVAFLVFGEAALFIGFVLPGETSVIIAGVVASQGRVNIVALCVLVVVAAILGDSVGYFVGQRWGARLLEMKLFQRRREDVDRAIEGLRRRGPFYVFLGRFTAFLRAVMPGLAGLSRMQYGRFLIANASGAIAWGVAFSLLGYFAGTALTKIEKYASWAGIAVLVVLVAVIVTIYFVRRGRDLERERGPR